MSATLHCSRCAHKLAGPVRALLEQLTTMAGWSRRFGSWECPKCAAVPIADLVMRSGTAFHKGAN